ncbi:unnamed protein product [Sphagnum compactum]
MKLRRMSSSCLMPPRPAWREGIRKGNANLARGGNPHALKPSADRETAVQVPLPGVPKEAFNEAELEDPEKGGVFGGHREISGNPEGSSVSFLCEDPDRVVALRGEYHLLGAHRVDKAVGGDLLKFDGLYRVGSGPGYTGRERLFQSLSSESHRSFILVARFGDVVPFTEAAYPKGVASRVGDERIAEDGLPEHLHAG